MKKTKTILLIAVLLGLICVGIVFVAMHTGKNAGSDQPQRFENLTWEEYLSLSLEQQDRFFEQFATKEDFEGWMEAVKPSESEPPTFRWEKAGKLPNEYTWEEYHQLTREEQDAFVNWFDSVEAFEAWQESAKPEETTMPVPKWDKSGKQPDAYTWEEYQALTQEEQEAFFYWFDSLEDFEAWQNKTKPTQPTEPTPQWNKPGKLPGEYTWEEYQKLTKEEQDAFFHWFQSEKKFESWMKNAQAEAPTEPLPEWNKPGKLPSEYTWEAYQKLTKEEQDAFFRWFKSVEDFENWMDKVRDEPATEGTSEWNKLGKLPSEYTWEDYQALTPKDQDAFFLWFESVEDFEAWMDAAKSVPTP